MKKKLILFVSLFTLMFAFFAFTFGISVHAEEPANAPEEQQQEVVEQEEEQVVVQEEVVLSEEDRSKINQLVDFLQSLSKDELINLLNEAKGWFIALGITGVVSLLAAFVGLIAAITKLRNEKIRNSNLTEEAKQQQIDNNNKTEKIIVDNVNDVKQLLLQFMNGLSDEDKKKVESNIATVKAKMLVEVGKTTEE